MAENQWTWNAPEDEQSLFTEDTGQDSTFSVVESPPLSIRPRNTAFERHPTAYEDPELKSRYKGEGVDWENFVGAELLRRYREAPSPKGMEHLMAHYDQLIESSVRRLGTRKLPEPAIRGKVYGAFAKAVENFAPGKGMQFHNYFTSYGQRGVRRWVDQNANFRKVATTRTGSLDKVRVLAKEFEIDQGRPPDAKEIAEMSGMRLADAKRIMPELDAVHIGSMNLRRDFVIDEANLYRRAVVRVADHLSGMEKRVYEDLFDVILGKPAQNMSMSAIAKKHGVSNSKISKLKTRYRGLIGTEINQLQNL